MSKTLIAAILLAVSLLLPAAAAPAAPGQERTAAPGGEPAAAGTLVLDLQTTLQMALANNLGLRSGVLAPQVAEHGVREQQGYFDPVLGGSFARALDTNPAPVDPFGTRPPSSEVRRNTYSAGFSGLLPTGATYRAGLSTQNQQVNTAAGNYYTFLGVEVSQPLLRGFGPQASLTPLRLARAQGETARWRYRQLVNDTITETTFAFYRLALARGSLEVAEQSVAVVERLVRDNEKRQQQGAMSTQDVVEARARAAQRREALYLGQQGVAAAENQLKRLISADLAALAGQRIEPRIAATEQPAEEQLLRWCDEAIALRPDYQQAVYAVEQRRIELGYERNREMPQVDLVASYGYNGSDAGFDGSWDQVREAENESYSVGAVMSVPVFNRSGTARRRAAVLELRRAELALAEMEQEVRRQLADARAEIAAATLRVESTREAEDYAEQSLQAEEKRFRTGTSSTFLVLEQQRLLAESQLRALQARADLAMAVADFHRLAGRTVEAFGIDPVAAGLAPAP